MWFHCRFSIPFSPLIWEFGRGWKEYGVVTGQFSLDLTNIKGRALLNFSSEKERRKEKGTLLNVT